MAVGVYLTYSIFNIAFRDSQFLPRAVFENIGLFIAYFFAKRIFLDKHFYYNGYVALLMLLISVQIVIPVLQWFDFMPSFNSNFKFTGFFFNPSPFAILLALLLLFSLATYCYSSTKLIRVLSIALFVSGIPIILVSLSRSAWLGLIAGTLYIVVFKFKLIEKAKSRLKRRNIKALILIFGMTVGSFAAYLLYYLKKDSADGRVLVWKLSFKMIRDYPYTGIGQGKFGTYFLKYQSSYFEHYPERISTQGRLADNVTFAYNDVLQIAVERGLVGAVLFSFILAISLKYSKCLAANNVSGSHGIMVGTIASLMALIVSGLFSYPLMLLPIQILFYIFLGILSAGYEGNVFTSIQYLSVALKRHVSSAFAVMALISAICILTFAASLGKACYLGKQLRNQDYSSNAMARLNKYNLIISHEDWYVLRKCDYLLYTGNYIKAIDELERAKVTTSNRVIYFSLGELYTHEGNYRKAEMQYRFLCFGLPNLVKPKYLLAKLYYNTGQAKKWEKEADEILNYTPKIASDETIEMIREIRHIRNKPFTRH